MAMKVFYKGRLLEGIDRVIFEYPENEFMKDAKNNGFDFEIKKINRKPDYSIFKYYMHRRNRYFFKNEINKLVITLSQGNSLDIKHYGGLYIIKMD